MADGCGVVVVGARHMGGTRGSGIVVRGMRGVGGICEICLCLARGGECGEEGE